MTRFGDIKNEDIVSRDTKFARVFLRGENSAVLHGRIAFGDSLGGL